MFYSGGMNGFIGFGEFEPKAEMVNSPITGMPNINENNVLYVICPLFIMVFVF